MSTKPDDIPQDVWDAAKRAYWPSGGTPEPKSKITRDKITWIANAIMAERERCARIAEDHGETDGTGPECEGCGEFIGAVIRKGAAP